MCMRVSYVDCHEAGLCCLPSDDTQKTYDVYYSCFTFIYDLFTHSPTYFNVSASDKYGYRCAMKVFVVQ
jgi:hypothetical protein